MFVLCMSALVRSLSLFLSCSFALRTHWLFLKGIENSTHTAYCIRLKCILFEVDATNRCVAIREKENGKNKDAKYRNDER